MARRTNKEINRRRPTLNQLSFIIGAQQRRAELDVEARVERRRHLRAMNGQLKPEPLPVVIRAEIKKPTFLKTVGQFGGKSTGREFIIVSARTGRITGKPNFKEVPRG